MSRRAAQEPPPPPPPPPAIQTIQTTEVLVEAEDVTFVDQSIDADSYVEAPVIEKKAAAAPPPPPPPPPPAPEPEVAEIFKVVEEMPRFPGCDSGTAAEKKACADEKLLQYLYKNLKYPAIARDSTALEWKLKRWVYNHSKLSIITPSKWLSNLAKQSLLGCYPIHTIPYGLDTQAYQLLIGRCADPP
ncbi:MAG: hypothetical protein HC799_20120 [Limnothrix sp. RL_2_0]|nr:hypothetical protein [Limnothrix sp. RL_2_0]